MPKKTARRIIDTRQATGTTILTGVTVSGSPGAGASAAMAGDGLTYSSGVLNVGAGTLVTVGADSVGITAGANYQFVGTGAGTAAAWQNISGMAGAGLTSSVGVLEVGAGAGLTVSADAVSLTNPGTLTVATSNDNTGSHTHAITASDDVTAGTTALLKATSGNLKLYSGNFAATAGYTSFTSGFAGAGWRVDYGVTEGGKASAEFDNLTIRGRMRVYELLIQQIRATNGSIFVSSTGKIGKVVSTSTNPLWTVNGVQLTFNGANATLTTTIYVLSVSTDEGTDDTGHYHGFLYGDVIRAQRAEWNGSAFVGLYQSNLEVTGVTDLYTFQGTLVSGNAAAVGYEYVRLGSATDSTRRGSVYMTADDSNAPYIDIVDDVASHSDWNTAGKIKARLGRLSGITDAEFGTLSGYGLWSDNVYLTGSIYATDGIFNGTVYATDGIFNGTVYASAGTFTGAITAQSGSIDGFLTIGTSGGIYQGTGTAGTPTTGLKIWNDSGIGRIGGFNGGDLQWFNDTSGRLYTGYNTTESKWGIRIARDGLRLLAEATTAPNISTSSSSIRWIFSPTADIDESLPTTHALSTISAFNKTDTGVVYLGMDNFVGTSRYVDRDSVVYMQAQHYTGSVYKTSLVKATVTKSTGASSVYIDADELQLTKLVKMTEMTAPSAPSTNSVYIYAEDNGSGKTRLMALFASGAAQQIAIQP